MKKDLLKIAMIKNGVKASDICEACGICSTAFYRKIKGITEFKQSEITVIRKMLKLTDEEVCEIFFAQ